MHQHTFLQAGQGHRRHPATRRREPVVSDLICATVARATGEALTIASLAGKVRAGDPALVCLRRQVAMYLSHVVFSLTHDEVGRSFKRDRSTVGYTCRRIEDRRDDRHFDELLDEIEEDVLERLEARGIR